MGKVSTRGSLSLFTGLIISNVISVVGVIFITRLLAPEEYGLYTVSLIPISLIIKFRDWGINFAMVRYIAYYNVKNDVRNTRRILVLGTVFELIIGSALSLIALTSAGLVASQLLNHSDAKPLIEIAAITILMDGLITAAQSVFTGFEKFKFNSLTMVLQSIVKNFAEIFLVIIGYGIFGATLGYTLSYVVTGVVVVLMLFFVFYRKEDAKPNLKETSDQVPIKTMLTYGFPLFISAILSGILGNILTFIMAIYCSDSLIGNYQVAVNFTVLVSFFTMPISTVLFPAFSKLSLETDKEALQTVFQSSIKYSAIIVIPIATAIMTLSAPLVFTLFGEKYLSSPLFLTLLTITTLFCGFGSLSIGNLLQSQGKTRIVLGLSIPSLVIGVPLGFILIPSFGIVGLIAATIIASIPSIPMGLWLVNKYYNARINWSSLIRTYLASGIAAIIAYEIIAHLSAPNWMHLIIGGIVFVGIYMSIMPLIGTLNENDIQNMRQIVSGLGLLTKILNYLIDILEKMMTYFLILSKSSKKDHMH